MRPRTAVPILVLALLAPAGARASRPPAGPDDPPAVAESWARDLETYCLGCHGERRPRGDLRLDRHSPEDLAADPQRWERALGMLRSGAMPPPSAPQPDEATRRRLVQQLGEWLRPADPAARTPTLRRLTRVEFDRSVRDLLGVEYDSRATFPADAFAEGLQGIGDVQFFTPTLIQKYWDAVEAILEHAFAEGSAIRSCLRAALDGRDESGAVQDLVGRLLDRGFRRSVSGHELERRLQLYDRARVAGEPPEQALRRVVQSILLSPYFLFRVEGERSPDAPWLDDFELATRLSYLLWSSMPDARLEALAALGRLHRPEVLATEVRRMLADVRSRSLAEGFAAQWLGYEEVPQLTPDVRRFRDFDETLRASALAESVRFVEQIVREDRSLYRLLDSPTTFLDERLARHYGIEGVTGGEMREVRLPDRRRGGVLGMASVLMTTSSPLRTSPVIRGAWVLDRLLGSPPPPPPPDAGTLPEDDRLPDGLSLRERLELHRREERCAACHARIDPLGLALESFDGIGRWRDEDQGRPVDARSVLPDGTELDGPVALKDWLLTKKAPFTRTVVEKMFVKAVGRTPTAADEDELQALVEAVLRDDGRFSTLVTGLVQGSAFRRRAAPSRPEDAARRRP